MSKESFRYTFAREMPLEEIEATLLLAILATENLHGEAKTRLDVSHFLNPTNHACVIDASTPAGQDLNRLFTGFINREFGADSFRVERLEKHDYHSKENAT